MGNFYQAVTGNKSKEGLFLDIYSGSIGAYSLRKIRSGYSGDCIEVYNGTSYVDIGFDSNNLLDLTALANHCGSNDGTVSKWYDQSTEGHTAVQTDTTLMPKIYDCTTGVELDNSKPTLQCTNKYMTAQGVEINGAMASVSVANIDNSTAEAALWAIIDSFNDGSEVIGLPSPSRIQYRLDANDTSFSETARRMLLFTSYDTSTKIFSVDGSATTTSVTTINNATGLEIGRRLNGNSYTGSIQSLIFWGNDQAANRADIETNMNTYYNVY